MGGCRVLSFLLGASAALSVDVGFEIPKYIVGIAGGFGVYIMGITTMARDEATGGRSPLLATGLVVTIVGIGLLALVTATVQSAESLADRCTAKFPLLVGMIGLPVILRAGSRGDRSETGEHSEHDSCRNLVDHSAWRPLLRFWARGRDGDWRCLRW